MKKSILALLFTLQFILNFPLQHFAQSLPYSHYWLELKDKQGTPYTIEQAESLLSQKALERRGRQGIAIDSTDLPVSPIYVEAVEQLGIDVKGSSKWLNALLVQINDSSQLTSLSNLNFIKSYKPVYKLEVEGIPTPVGLKQNKALVFESNEYGAADAQMELVNGKYLHNKSYTGEGKTIAVLDAGFTGSDWISAFDALYANDKIHVGGDPVGNSETIFQKSTHGTMVLSIMGGRVDGQFLGTAPDANYILFRTENTDSEFPIEESYWIFAAEKADSMGVDIISSSLGYSEFQDTALDLHYLNMNGETAMISRGANMAAKKGIFVVTSAGNEGNSNWHYITAPGDAKDVLTIGAVNADGELASFSSRGPTFDKRIKPDVVSVGWNTALVDQNGNVTQGNGTSFSAPHISGMAACLWQAAPDLTNLELLETIQQSANMYQNPDSNFGYGIPDFEKAYLLAINKGGNENVVDFEINSFPNPFTDQISILLKVDSEESVKVQLTDVTGKILFEDNWELTAGNYSEKTINGLSGLNGGVYFLRVQKGETWEVERVFKF